MPEKKNLPEKKTLPKSAARYVAAQAVRDVLRNGTALDQALAAQALFTQLDSRDRAFARLISATVFRRLGQIDKILSGFIKKNTPDLALAVLRCGTAQIVFLGTPPYAAVNGAVALLRRSKKSAHMAGLANAVLRRVGEQKEELVKHTSTLDNIPKWLRTSWYKNYGGKALQKMADLYAKEPPLDLTLKNPDGQAGIDYPEGEALPGGTIRLAKAGGIPALAGYKEGHWWVQDISAALPVRLLSQIIGDLRGKKVLDMCAAPGGKTLQLAALGADVTALDKQGARLQRLVENLKRAGLQAQIQHVDALKYTDTTGFDVVLLDAPCSATGTFRRRPDVLQTKSPEDVSSLARVQEKMLLAAARNVRSGGTLIYCTCSLQRREGEEQVTRFKKNRPDFCHISMLDTPLLGDLDCVKQALTQDGTLRLLPHFLWEKGGQDGFFIAAFTRR